MNNRGEESVKGENEKKETILEIANRVYKTAEIGKKIDRRHNSFAG